MDNGAEQSAGGARSDRGSLRLAEQSAASLLSGLIEPGLHALIPVLLEVGIRQNVVVLHLAKIYGTVRHPFAEKKTIISKPTKDSYSCREENHTRESTNRGDIRSAGIGNSVDFRDHFGFDRKSLHSPILRRDHGRRNQESIRGLLQSVPLQPSCQLF